MRWFKQYPWYSLIFALYSPMALIAYNVGQVQFGAVLRSLAIVLTAVFILTSLVLFVVRDGPKAGLIVTLALVLFFSYGHVYDLMAKGNIGGLLIGRHRYLIVLSTGCSLSGCLLDRKEQDAPLRQWSSTLTTIAIVALVFPFTS